MYLDEKAIFILREREGERKREIERERRREADRQMEFQLYGY